MSISLFICTLLVLLLYSLPFFDLIVLRTRVNGRMVTERTQLRHGYRILLGNNHLFRLSCPKIAGSGERLEDTHTHTHTHTHTRMHTHTHRVTHTHTHMCMADFVCPPSLRSGC